MSSFVFTYFTWMSVLSATQRAMFSAAKPTRWMSRVSTFLGFPFGGKCMNTGAELSLSWKNYAPCHLTFIIIRLLQFIHKLYLYFSRCMLKNYLKILNTLWGVWRFECKWHYTPIIQTLSQNAMWLSWSLSILWGKTRSWFSTFHESRKTSKSENISLFKNYSGQRRDIWM